MVALVTRGSDDTLLGVHRTFLDHGGAGKAPVEPQKMMLGPCRGGAVRLGTAGNVLMVGEGIETCLSAMQAKGYPAWAALSTSGLRALDLPMRRARRASCWPMVTIPAKPLRAIAAFAGSAKVVAFVSPGRRQAWTSMTC